jgi:D-alanyl-D-alanine dipeptidase
VDLLNDAAAAVFSRPMPKLRFEAAVLRQAGAAEDNGEPLVELADSPRLTVLHSYARAGWHGSSERQYLRSGALDRLRRAAAALPDGFGLAVFDAWRPLSLQRELFSVLAAAGAGSDFVALPSDDPATPPPHLTGGTVDLTLTWRGTPLELGTPFDDFTASASADAFEDRPGPVRTLRRLLYHQMRDQGYVILAEEWWHFELGTRLWSVLSDRPAFYGPASP